MYLYLIIIAVIFVIYLLTQNSNSYGDIDKLPGPPKKFFFGNALEFGSGPVDSLKNEVQLIKKYGPIFRMWLGSEPAIILTDADKVQFILSSNMHIKKSKGYDGLKIWLGNGLINSAGSHWFKHRRIITRTFHFKMLEQYMVYFNMNIKTLFSTIKEKQNKTFDIMPIISNFALDVISESAMGIKVNAQNEPKSEYINAIKEFLVIYMSRFFSFYKQYDFIFKFTSDYRKQLKCVKVLKDLTTFILRTKLENRNTQKNKSIVKENDENQYGIKNKVAFLDLLLNLEQDNGLSFEEIREELDTFMFAGHDTVTSAVCFALYEFSKHPDVQIKLVEESNDILGDDHNAEISVSQINSLNYLDRVVKECMRIHTPVPLIERELEEDIYFDEKLIPKGTRIRILPFALHQMEEHYPNPEKFDPDRFLVENCEKRHTFAYLPFSAGPRNCVGFRYALMFVKTTLIRILRNFDVLPATPEHTPIYANKAVLSSENGIYLKLKPKQQI